MNFYSQERKGRKRLAEVPGNNRHISVAKPRGTEFLGHRKWGPETKIGPSEELLGCTGVTRRRAKGISWLPVTTAPERAGPTREASGARPHRGSGLRGQRRDPCRP